MKTLFRHIRQFLLGLGIVALAALCACGSNQSAPTGSGGDLVTVEIPAVTDVNDLVYITGPVVAGAGADLSAKSLSKKLGMMGNPFTPVPDTSNSVVACETNKLTRGLISDGSVADLGLCLLKSVLEDFVTIKAPVVAATIDDGTDKDLSIWIESDDGPSEIRARVNISKYESGSFSGFTMYFCQWNSTLNAYEQTMYLNETFGPTGAITIHSTQKDNYNSGTSTSNSKISVVGSLNMDAGYTEKQIHQQNYRENNSGNDIEIQEATLTHLSDSEATINGFRHRRNVEQYEGHVEPTITYTDTRIFSDFTFMYNDGVLTTNLDNSLWAIFSGAGRLIDQHYDHTECWDENGKVEPPSCSYLTEVLKPENAPIEIDTTISPTTLAYAAGETYDCGAPVYEVASGKPGSKGTPLNIDNLTECQGFGSLDDIDPSCYEITYGDFAATPSYNGVTLSTSANAPTIVSSNTPTLQFTTNYAPNLESFTKIQIENYQPPEGYHHTIDGENFNALNSDYTEMTFTYGPISGDYKYMFTLGQGQQGVDGRTMPIANAVTYYIQYVGP